MCPYSRRPGLRWLPVLCLFLISCPRPPRPAQPGADRPRGQIEVYTESGRVNALIAKGRSLWAGTGQGLILWNLEENRARILTEHDGLPSREVLALADGGTGALWVGTSKGIARFQEGAWSQFGDCPLEPIRAMAATPDGTTAFAGGPQGLAQIQGETWRMVLPKVAVTALLYSEADETLWVGTETQGVMKCRKGGCEAADSGKLARGQVTFLARAASSTLAILDGRRIAYQHQGMWHHYRPEPPLRLTWAHFGRDRIFLGAGDGVFALVPRRERESKPGPLQLKPDNRRSPEFLSSLIKRPLPRHVTAVIQGAGGLWIGSLREGVARFDGDLLTYFRTGDLVAGARRLSVACGDRDACLLSTGSRLFLRAGGTFRTQSYAPDSDAQIQWVGQDAKGVLAVLRNGHGGLDLARRAGEAWTPLELQPLLESRTGPITATFARLAPSGHVWVGLAIGTGESQRGAGVAVIDPNTGTLVLHGDSADLPKTKGSLDFPGELTGVAFLKGSTFLGSRQGVVHLDPRGVVRVLTENDGLASEVIRDILETRDGRVWVATGAGLGFYDGERWQFAEERGPRSSSTHALATDPEGNLWFGGDSGVHRLTGQKLTSWDDGDGLFARSVRDVAVDARGRAWVLHQRGLSILTP